MVEVGKIFPEIFKREVRRADSRLIDILAPLWPRVAGKTIAAQSRPVDFEAGTLALETSCSTWAAELRRMQDEIREETNSFLGSQIVKRIRVRFVHRQPQNAIECRVNKIPGSSAFCSGSFSLQDRLDPEITRILERSFAKYFSRAQEKEN